MSLADSFPEIEAFFNQDAFNHEDLIDLIHRLCAEYRGIDLRKAQDCAKLKFLGYELKKSKVESNVEIPIDYFNGPWKPIDGSTLKAKVVYSIKDLSNQLQWSVGHLQRLIEQKTGISHVTTLTKKEYAKCAEAIDSRKKALARQAKAEHFALEDCPRKNIFLSNNSSRKKSATSSSVAWGEVAKYGPGKLIYIRSR